MSKIAPPPSAAPVTVSPPSPPPPIMKTQSSSQFGPPPPSLPAAIPQQQQQQPSALHRSPSMPPLSPPRSGTPLGGGGAGGAGAIPPRAKPIDAASVVAALGGTPKTANAPSPGTPSNKKAHVVPMTRPNAASNIPSPGAYLQQSKSMSVVPTQQQQPLPSALRASTSAPTFNTSPAPQSAVFGSPSSPTNRDSAPVVPSPRPKPGVPPPPPSPGGKKAGLTVAQLTALNRVSPPRAAAAAGAGRTSRASSVGSSGVAVSVPAAPPSRPGGSPNRFRGSVNAVVAANRFAGGVSPMRKGPPAVPKARPSPVSSPNKFRTAADAAIAVNRMSPLRPGAGGGGGPPSIPKIPPSPATSPNKFRGSVNAVVAANRMKQGIRVPAAPVIPPSPSRRSASPTAAPGAGSMMSPVSNNSPLASKRVPPPPPARSNSSINGEIRPYGAATSPSRDAAVSAAPASASNNAARSNWAAVTSAAITSPKRIPSGPTNRPNQQQQQSPTDDPHFEVRLLRQKVGALESEIGFLRHELDAARGTSPSRANRMYPSPHRQQQQLGGGGSVPSEHLSYSMQQRDQHLAGMNLDQRLAALQDLQYHMSMAKAITDNVHVSSLAAPHADAMNISPARHHLAPPLGGDYSPSQQQMINAAVRDAQQALSDNPAVPYHAGTPKYIGNGAFMHHNDYWRAALNRPTAVQSFDGQ